MILKRNDLIGIKSGKITLVFRKWKRPTVKAGGTLRNAMGVIRIISLETIAMKAITDSEARKAGYPDAAAILARLQKIDEGKVYRIRVTYESEDPRIDLREKTSLSGEEFNALLARLDRLDRASRVGPWTRQYLRLINKYPERRAGDIAEMIGMDKFDFKTNVRKLKNLGLTVSHEIGYSISPLGNWVMQHWNKQAQSD
jgi:hypothetical protein